jgi:hemoglobin-like flavoprotein
MTTQQVEMVKESWNKVTPLGSAAGELFYSNLFVSAPHLKKLFPADVKPQSEKLVSMISYIVLKLDKADELIPEVKKLAARHNNYGVKEEHYHMVGGALLMTLQQAFAEKWTEELRQSWIAAYALLANTMIAAQLESAA